MTERFLGNQQKVEDLKAISRIWEGTWRNYVAMKGYPPSDYAKLEMLFQEDTKIILRVCKGDLNEIKLQGLVTMGIFHNPNIRPPLGFDLELKKNHNFSLS